MCYSNRDFLHPSSAMSNNRIWAPLKFSKFPSVKATQTCIAAMAGSIRSMSQRSGEPGTHATTTSTVGLDKMSATLMTAAQHRGRAEELREDARPKAQELAEQHERVEGMIEHQRRGAVDPPPTW